MIRLFGEESWLRRNMLLGVICAEDPDYVIARRQSYYRYPAQYRSTSDQGELHDKFNLTFQPQECCTCLAARAWKFRLCSSSGANP